MKTNEIFEHVLQIVCEECELCYGELINGANKNAVDDLFEQVEFFVDSVSGYQSDFVLFPEYFNAPLMARFNDASESQAIRGLARYTDEIRERFINLAIRYNINIITGSMPLIKEDGLLYNVGFLCRRDVLTKCMKNYMSPPTK